uniref:N-terminal E2 ubiquitin-conjugating enzyme n=119 Tax=Archelosauria TaxID=1329799 RepID=A0A8C3FI10_CHRPI
RLILNSRLHHVKKPPGTRLTKIGNPQSCSTPPHGAAAGANRTGERWRAPAPRGPASRRAQGLSCCRAPRPGAAGRLPQRRSAQRPITRPPLPRLRARYCSAGSSPATKRVPDGAGGHGVAQALRRAQAASPRFLFPPRPHPSPRCDVTPWRGGAGPVPTAAPASGRLAHASSCFQLVAPRDLAGGGRDAAASLSSGPRRRRRREGGGSIMASMQKRLQKELLALQNDPPPGMTLNEKSVQNSITQWIVDMEGAPGTLYEGEKFQLLFKFSSRYPFDSPQVMFTGDNIPVHPHVYSNGHICLSILTEDWSPALSVQSVCLSIISMLSSCKEKRRPPDNSFYVRTCNKNPKKTKWWYHGKYLIWSRNFRGLLGWVQKM